MKSRRRINSNRRKFRKTNNKIHRKSRRNTKKIMNGGASENIGSDNITELDKVGKGLPYSSIHMSKIFTSEDDAKNFESYAIDKIGGRDNIKSSSGVMKYGNKKTTKDNIQPRFFWNTVTKIEVPAEYKVGFSTNEKGKDLAIELIEERDKLPDDMKSTITVKVASYLEVVT